MKLHDVEQGSGEWLKLRLGIPTASQFHKIITPATCKLSKQARGYAFFLVAEELLNQSLDALSGLEWIARGKELEPQAIKMYEFEQEVRTAKVGLITTDDMRLGATPDRLIVGSPAALEIKCPAPHTHLEYLLDGFGADYVPQVQGQILVGEFEWVDRYSYHPEMPPAVVRTYRDDAYQKVLSSALDEFCDMKDELLERARARGLFAERKRLLTVVDTMAASAVEQEETEDVFGLPPLRDAVRARLSGGATDQAAVPAGAAPRFAPREEKFWTRDRYDVPGTKPSEVEHWIKHYLAQCRDQIDVNGLETDNAERFATMSAGTRAGIQSAIDARRRELPPL